MRQSFLWSYMAGFLLLLNSLGYTLVDPAWSHKEEALSLTFLGYVSLKDLGIREPSGLALGYSSTGKPRLWVVSDDSASLFVLKEKRRSKTLSTFKISGIYSFSSDLKELEGLTLGGSGEPVIVQEGTNSVIRLDASSFEEVDRISLSAIAGFDRIQDFFSDTSDNKGLEGIAWQATQGTFFVVKEGRPPMLIELRSDLRAILNYWILDEERGFSVPGISKDKLDLSGIVYDSLRDVLWLVSDKGQHLFVYDYHQHLVTQRLPLGYRAGKGKGIGTYRRIEKAEGVALSPDGQTLYIVSDDDDDSRLYVYGIQK